MTLTDQDIEEFRAIWQEEFGESLSPDEARHCASRLMSLYFGLAEILSQAREEGDEPGSNPPQ